MSDENHEDEKLSTLFDGTAEQPSPASLTKLHARAADVPGRVRRQRSIAWIVLPTALGSIAALAFVLVQHRSTSFSPTRPLAAVPRAVDTRPATPSTAPAEPPSAVARSESTAAPTSEPAADDVTDELGFDTDDSDDAIGAAAALDTELGPSEGDGIDAMDDPPSDANLDVWLRATDELMQEGG